MRMLKSELMIQEKMTLEIAISEEYIDLSTRIANDIMEEMSKVADMDVNQFKDWSIGLSSSDDAYKLMNMLDIDNDEVIDELNNQDMTFWNERHKLMLESMPA